MAPAKPAPPLEWEPFDEEQRDIYAHCVAELGPELRGLPDDLVTMLVRGVCPSSASAAHTAQGQGSAFAAQSPEPTRRVLHAIFMLRRLYQREGAEAALGRAHDRDE